MSVVKKRNPQRWNIQRVHVRTLFTQIKTISIYRVLGCCVLLKNQNLVSNEMGQAILRPYISTKDARSIYSISLGNASCELCTGFICHLSTGESYRPMQSDNKGILSQEDRLRQIVSNFGSVCGNYAQIFVQLCIQILL